MAEISLDKQTIQFLAAEIRKRWLTTAEAAKYIGIRKTDLLSLIEGGIIAPVCGIGRARKIDLHDLDELMNSLKVRKKGQWRHKL